MRFECDEAKNVANQKKHGVTFETATKVFNDPLLLLRADRIDHDGEQRWHAIGMADAAVLLVVHVYRSTNENKEIIRIISAREASKRER